MLNFLLALVAPFNLPYYPLRSVSFQVVNDLLNPAGQNLRIREDAQVLFSFSDLFLVAIIFINYCSTYDDSFYHLSKCFYHIINHMFSCFMMNLIRMVSWR